MGTLDFIVEDDRALLRQPTLYVNAPNIHCGGGAVILNALLKADFDKSPVCFFVDERFQAVSSRHSLERVPPTVMRRLLHERLLATKATRSDVVLCLGNLPPLFTTAARSAVFLQNRFLVEPISTRRFSLFERLRIATERLWFRCRIGNSSALFVQTRSMKDTLDRSGLVARDFPICVAPVVPDDTTPVGQAVDERPDSSSPVSNGAKFSFLYVASAEPHKNHHRLIEAWKLLAEDGIFPTLRLTIDSAKDTRLHEAIRQIAREQSLDIALLGHLRRDELFDEYRRASALIYPSTFESFGLPLVEASNFNLPVLAPELDYVRDIVKPVEVFDPNSARSIARSVRRFIGQPEQSQCLMSASQFLQAVWDMRQ